MYLLSFLRSLSIPPFAVSILEYQLIRRYHVHPLDPLVPKRVDLTYMQNGDYLVDLQFVSQKETGDVPVSFRGEIFSQLVYSALFRNFRLYLAVLPPNGADLEYLFSVITPRVQSVPEGTIVWEDTFAWKWEKV